MTNPPHNNNQDALVLVWDTSLPEVEEVTAQVKVLSRMNSYRTLLAIGFDWLVIALAILVGTLQLSFWTWLPLVVIIASRQHALAILMHEGAHYRIFKNRQLNDRVSNWLLAYPILITTEGYRKSHLPHHTYLNTDKDPDWVRKRDFIEWKFPKTKFHLVCLFLKILSGAGAAHLLGRVKAYAKTGTKKEEGQKPKKTTIGQRVLFYSIALATISFFGVWFEFLVFWVIPLFTLTPLFLRIRSIAEHFSLPWKGDLTMSRSIECHTLEKFFFAPHNIHYHLEHHLYPSVPFYNVPKLRKVLMEMPYYREHAHTTHGFFRFSQNCLWKELTK